MGSGTTIKAALPEGFRGLLPIMILYQLSKGCRHPMI
jgi:hypothetical protein